MKLVDQWLPLWMIVAPLVGIVLLLFIPKSKAFIHRTIGICATLPSLFFAIYAYKQFDLGRTDNLWQWEKAIQWFKIPIGTHDSWILQFHLGMDGLSLPLAVLTAIVSTFAAIAAIYIKEKTKGFYMLFLLLEASMLTVFLTANLLLFFIAFEITLVVTYFFISLWGYFRRERAAIHFLIYNGIGSGFLLFAVIGVLITCQTLEMPLIEQRIPALFAENQWILWSTFTAFLLAFAIKLPVFPFHSWMLRVHVEANPAIVMIHSGILLKMGAYGFLRFGVGWFPALMKEMALVFAIFGLINLFYGALLAFVQNELKRVLAYASVSHMGIFLLGVASLNSIGLQGALFQAISHGLISALCFFLVASLYERTKTTELPELSGIAKNAPIFAGFFLLAGLALLGLPGLSGFISEFFSFLGLFNKYPILAAIGTIGLVVAVSYTLRAFLFIIWGPSQERFQQISDLRLIEWTPMLVVTLLIVAIGIYPDLLGKPMQATLQTIALRIGG